MGIKRGISHRTEIISLAFFCFLLEKSSRPIRFLRHDYIAASFWVWIGMNSLRERLLIKGGKQRRTKEEEKREEKRKECAGQWNNWCEFKSSVQRTVRTESYEFAKRDGIGAFQQR